jgi:hypothetical protein
MTDDQKRILRMETWERYESAKSDLAARRARITGWRVIIANLSLRLEAESFDDIEQDYAKLPTDEEFIQSIGELKATKQRLQQTYNEAKDNGFPLD